MVRVQLGQDKAEDEDEAMPMIALAVIEFKSLPVNLASCPIECVRINAVRIGEISVIKGA